MSDHDSVVQQQFGDRADAYLASSVHAHGEEFALLREQLRSYAEARVLDLGCGAGHVSFQLAPLAREVVAYDPAQPMLDLVAATAHSRALANIRTQRGSAEALPFADSAFHFVASRFSAHHWSDLERALREVRRVLKPSGRAVFIDVAAPGSPLLDTFLQALELLRDPSHVRDYSSAEWFERLGAAGLQVDSYRRQRLRLEFESWVRRSGTPAPMREALLLLQKRVGEEVRDYFEIAADGSFTCHVIVLVATPLAGGC